MAIMFMAQEMEMCHPLPHTKSVNFKENKLLDFQSLELIYYFYSVDINSQIQMKLLWEKQEMSVFTQLRK